MEHPLAIRRSALSLTVRGETMRPNRQPHLTPVSWTQGRPVVLKRHRAGLPGAEWWVAGRAVDQAEDAEVELNEVERLYTEQNMWDSVFDL